MKYFLLPLLLLILLGCQSKRRQSSSMSNAFTVKEDTATGVYDLEAIRRAGELIIATLPGPDTYFEYHGMGMGKQYVLAEDFAKKEGLRLRVVMASDTLALLRMLARAEADVVALPVAQTRLSDALIGAGYHEEEDKRWVVKKSAKQLVQALNEWFNPELLTTLTLSIEERMKKLREVKRQMKAVYLSPTRGIISVYDHLFKQASATTGWDWRLLAAQCYQESGFDPNARSYAGAQGLMQLMPSTAASVGVASGDITNPEKNILGAARYIQTLNRNFADVQDARERIKYVLAAYNGGLGHVRDAMVLTRKYGGNPQRWDEVAPYILALQRPEYYRDPVVKYGYMIGSETDNYVRSILARYQSYGGSIAMVKTATMPDAQATSPSVTTTSHPVRNKYSSGAPIYSPDDPEFNEMNQP